MRAAPLLAAAALAAATTTSMARGEDPPGPESPRESAPTELAGWVEGGYAGQALHGVPAGGFDVSVALGGRKGAVEGGFVADYLHAETSYGIASTSFTAGMFAQLRVLRRLRLGGGVRVGAFDVARVTNGGSLWSGSAGLFGRLSFDLVPFGRDGAAGVYLFAKGSIDSVDTALYQGVLGLGVGL